VKGVSEAEIGDITTRNFLNLFNIEAPDA
jgi:hypothetical protein